MPITSQQSSLVVSVVQNVVIPEILAIIRAHHNATGNLPTDAQVLAALQLDANRVISVGEAFLASKLVPVVLPAPGAGPQG